MVFQMGARVQPTHRGTHRLPRQYYGHKIISETPYLEPGRVQQKGQCTRMPLANISAPRRGRVTIEKHLWNGCATETHFWFMYFNEGRIKLRE